MSVDATQNLTNSKELYSQYSWFYDAFSQAVQNACDTFFTPNFKSEFFGLSKNVNYLSEGDSCFVTKITIQDDYDMFLRLNEKAVGIILDKILGKSKSRFLLNRISDIETKIITAFSSYIYNEIKPKLQSPNPRELKRNNFDAINLVYILKDIDENVDEAGKVFISLPSSLLAPENITSSSEKFSKDDFDLSEIVVNITVGSMNFPLYEVKHLDSGDVVVFENSNIEHMKLKINDDEMEININPNMELLIPDAVNEEVENQMAQGHNIWDTIEVDMNAQFDAVKITLGELKDIENGLVVDLASLYDNNVTLSVEGKKIATGSLVIVNDRYGVKVKEVYAGVNAEAGATNKSVSSPQNEENSEERGEISNNEEETVSTQEEYNEQGSSGEEGSEEEFDYSDFDLEDENI